MAARHPTKAQKFEPRGRITSTVQPKIGDATGPAPSPRGASSRLRGRGRRKSLTNSSPARGASARPLTESSKQKAGRGGHRCPGGTQSARRAAVAGEAGKAREAAARSVEPSRAEPRRSPSAPALVGGPGRRRGLAGRAALQPMELENIVANTVLLKAREGEARQAGGQARVRGSRARDLRAP